jgi:hypothetical protein
MRRGTCGWSWLRWVVCCCGIAVVCNALRSERGRIEGGGGQRASRIQFVSPHVLICRLQPLAHPDGLRPRRSQSIPILKQYHRTQRNTIQAGSLEHPVFPSTSLSLPLCIHHITSHEYP